MRDLRPVFAERADHVADDLGAAEQFGQRSTLVVDLGHFVVGGFDAGDLVHHRLVARLVAAGGDEGHMQFAQIFANETAGIAGGAVDDDGLLVAHDFVSSSCTCSLAAGLAPTFPCRRRPAGPRR